MKYNQADKPKIIVLSVVLALVVGYIVVRSVQLRREWKGREDARAEQHQLAHAATADPEPGIPPASGDGSSTVEDNPLLKALVYPPEPPERDPFYPVIAPRSSRPAASTGTSRPRPTPVLSTQLPPFSGSSGPGDILRVTGIITGDPSTAVLRVGDEHYVVRVGDWLDNTKRVEAIGASTVTVRESKRSYTLRLGR
jgi:hypothetical protein